MAKQNTKAGATQLSQDMATAEAAEATKQQAVQEQSAPQSQTAVSQESTSAPSQEQTGTADQSSEQSGGENGQEGSSPDLVVTPVAVTPAAPVVVEPPKAVVVEAAQPVASNASTVGHLNVILKDVPGAYQIDINRILTYLERMSPKRPIDTKAGVAEQIALYRSIQNIINRQEAYFTQLFTALLFLFKAEANGALNDRYRMRFMENITLPVGDRKAFANITQMLAILADPKSRPTAMKQVNMVRALENGLTADGRKRVLAYFDM